MAWIYRGNVNLPQADRDNNAWEIYNFFHSQGWAVESIAAMAGNIDVESTVNPQRINANSGARGLTQWLGNRRTMMIDYVTNTLGYSSWDNGDGQIRYILHEEQAPSSTEGWLKRGGYDRTFSQFATNSENDSLQDLAYMWQMCYERVSIGVPVPVRYRRTQYYYQLFRGGPGPGPGNVPKWLLYAGRRKQKRVNCTIHI